MSPSAAFPMCLLLQYHAVLFLKFRQNLYILRQKEKHRSAVLLFLPDSFLPAVP